MISCYTLLAVYLSTSGALNVSNLDHSYFLLKRDGEVYGSVEYVDKGRETVDTYGVSLKHQFSPSKLANDTTTVDVCEVKGKKYHGVFNHFEAPLK